MRTLAIARGSIVVLVLVLSTMYVACAHAAQTPPTAAETWTLTFHVSGGIAGFDRELHLTSDGSANATDARRSRRASRQIAPDELKAITRLLADARSLEAVGAGCRDCVEYRLDIGRAPPVRITANDPGLAQSAAAPLIRALTSILQRTLQ
jgi:hypothetical protein